MAYVGTAQLYLITTVQMRIIQENLELSVYFLKKLCKNQIVVTLNLSGSSVGLLVMHGYLFVTKRQERGGGPHTPIIHVREHHCGPWIHYVMLRPTHILHINIVINCIVFVVQSG